MHCREYSTLLSREESGAVKGLLILLIVLGHNSLIMQPTGLFPYLYSFHVYCFYIFPFIYGFRAESDDIPLIRVIWEKTLHNFRRLYPLYIIWCGIGIFASHFIKHQEFEIFRTIYSVISGNQVTLSQYCGFAFLWFLPTIVAVMFWRDVFFCLPRWGKCVQLCISLALWTLAVMGFTNFHHSGNYIPFALAQGLYFCASGILARWILEHTTVSVLTRTAAIPLFMLIPVFIRFRGYLPPDFTWLSWLIPPTVAFICIYQFKKYLSRSRMLRFIGEYSLQIYILHIIVFNAFLKTGKFSGLAAGVVIYILTIVCCIAAAYCMKLTPVKWMIFPWKGRQT